MTTGLGSTEASIPPFGAEDGSRHSGRDLQTPPLEPAAGHFADPALVDVAHAALGERRRALHETLAGLLTPAQRQDLLALMGFGGFEDDELCF